MIPGLPIVCFYLLRTIIPGFRMMTAAHLVGEQAVEILGVVGPDQLVVRPLSFSSHYDRLQKHLGEVSKNMEKLLQPKVNQSCAVLYENRWHRGLVEVIERLTCQVRFVDLWRKSYVNFDALRKLPDHFLQEHAYCLPCHLPGCSDMDDKILEVELGSRKKVSLHRRGVPEMKAGVWSMPVEICWEEEKYVDPVGLPVQQTVFLSQRMLHTMRVQGESTLDTTKSEEET